MMFLSLLRVQVNIILARWYEGSTGLKLQTRGEGGGEMCGHPHKKNNANITYVFYGSFPLFELVQTLKLVSDLG